MSSQTFETQSGITEVPGHVNDVCDRVKTRLQYSDEGLENRCNIVATKLKQVFHAYNYDASIIQGVITPPRITYPSIENAIKDNAYLHWWVHVTTDSTTYLIDLHNDSEYTKNETRCKTPTETYEPMIIDPEGSIAWYGVSDPIEWVNESK